MKPQDGRSRTDLIARGLGWFDPSISRDGRNVAFDTGFESPAVRVKLFDVRARTVKTLSKPGRAFPVFAGPNTVWAQEIKPCKGECALPTTNGNHVFAIDTRTGQERLLALQSLSQIDVLYE